MHTKLLFKINKTFYQQIRMANRDLTPSQAEAYAAILDGHNIVITGQAGSGLFYFVYIFFFIFQKIKYLY